MSESVWGSRPSTETLGDLIEGSAHTPLSQRFSNSVTSLIEAIITRLGLTESGRPNEKKSEVEGVTIRTAIPSKEVSRFFCLSFKHTSDH